MNKFNIGDKVIFKKWEEMVEEFGINSSGNIIVKQIFTKSMKYLCGEVGYIVSNNNDSIGIRLVDQSIKVNYVISAGMLKLYKEELIEEEKLTVGDYVLVKDWLKLAVNHSIDQEGDICTHPYFVRDMKKYCGKVMRVAYIDDFITLSGEFEAESWHFPRESLIKIKDLKSIIKNNMVVQLTNGDRLILINDTLVGKEKGLKFEYYDKNLKKERSSHLNIDYIYSTKEGTPLNYIFLDENLKQIWEREKEIDWSKVEIDTKILVSTDKICWYKRYFAGEKDGKIKAYDNGKTSFTVSDAKNSTCWEHAKLA